MASVRGSLKKTIDTMSKLTAEEVHTPVPPTAVAPPMSGEKLHVWLVQVPGLADEVPLPYWLTDGITSTISKWVAERNEWTKEIDKCHAKDRELGPKKQAAYDAWLGTPERRCSCRAADTCTMSHHLVGVQLFHVVVCLRSKITFVLNLQPSASSRPLPNVGYVTGSVMHFGRACRGGFECRYLPLLVVPQ